MSRVLTVVDVDDLAMARGYASGVVRTAKDPIWSILSVGEGAKPR